MYSTEIAIIGGGVVGLAIAAVVSQAYKNVILLERHESFGRETSSRSSEVIHASIYYPRNYLKGRLCLEGNEMMYEICRNYNIPHVNSGKLIIACDSDEVNRLPEWLELAQNNGARGVRIIDHTQISILEPNVTAQSAIFCPSSGTVDSHSLMQHFEAFALSNGADIVYRSEVVSIERKAGNYILGIRASDGKTDYLETRVVINSAGLESGNIAALAGINIDQAGYRIHYHKGFYFRVIRNLDKYPRMLIYPLPPESGSVGIHTTPDLAGGMRLGPHFVWSDNIDYSVDESYRDYFYEEARRWLPFLQPEDLQPDTAGIMSAIQKPGEGMKDFIIKEESEQGLPGLINLIGIESPGLTASPAIARMVKQITKDYLH